MLIEIIVATMLGVMAGIFTGLTPGIHVNLLAVLLLSLADRFSFMDPFLVSIVIVCCALTHTFLDCIPSIFLGAPDSDTAMGVLPGHRLLLAGEGYKAVMLTLVGSLFSLIATICLIPYSLPYLPVIADTIQPYMGHLLLAVAASMIWMEKGAVKKIWALAIFLVSGTFGILVLNMQIVEQPLFCLLSGMFGISTLLTSLCSKVNIPAQTVSTHIDIGLFTTAKSVLAAVFSGSLTGLFPGLGGAQASIIGMQLTRNSEGDSFLVLVGGVNTVNFVFSLATLLALQKARNGAIVSVMEIMGEVQSGHVIIFIAASMVAAGISTILCIYIGKRAAALITKINYAMICKAIIMLIIIMTLLLCKPIGLLVLATSTAIGILPQKFNVKRSHCMGMLLLPVIFYFLL